MDLLRVLAIYLVMFIHTGTRGYFLFSVKEQSPFYGLYLFISIAVKVASPIFLMISGALLLKKVESISTVYKKRFLRMLVILITVSAVYQIYYCTRGNETFQMLAFLKRLYTKPLSVALWYQYAYLGVLTVLPFFQKLAQRMANREFVYMAGMYVLLTGIIPMVEYRLWQGSVTINYHFLRWTTFTLNASAGRSIVFFFLGYYFEHVLPEKYYTPKNAFIGVLLSLLAVGISAYMTVYKVKVTGVCKESASQAFHISLIAIPACTTYFCAKLYFKMRNVSQRTKDVLAFLGGTIMGVYLLEGILRRETQFVFEALKPVLGTLPACAVWIFCALVAGVCVT